MELLETSNKIKKRHDLPYNFSDGRIAALLPKRLFKLKLS